VTCEEEEGKSKHLSTLNTRGRSMQGEEIIVVFERGKSMSEEQPGSKESRARKNAVKDEVRDWWGEGLWRPLLELWIWL
jgi:hypothetical protein